MVYNVSIKDIPIDLKTCINFFPSPIILVDLSGQIEEWNAATENTFGWSDGECEKSIADYALPEHRKTVQLLLECAVKGETIQNVEIEWLHKNGIPLVVLVTLVPVRNFQQELAGIYIFCTDVTSQRATEKALQQAKNEASRAHRIQSDFLANISHEIRTPLTTIIGLADILNDTKLDNRQRNWLTTLQNSSEHLLALINDLLDYAKIDAGKFELETIAFSLHQLIDSLQTSLRPLLDQKHLDFQIELPPQLPPQISGDPLRLQQVLFNLLKNAIHFTPNNGRIALRIFNTSSSQDYNLIRLDFEVSDTGIGMDQDTLDRLFTPFVQSDCSTSRQSSGVGLGLTISQQLIHLMGGKINVNSKLGQGSIFRFSAGFKIIDKKRASFYPEPASDPSPLRSRLILVVEDFLPNQEVIELQLRSLGCEVHMANDGFEAVTMAKARRYDTILMDVRMPNMDGLEATRQIRRNEDSGLPPVPIVAVSADVQPRERQHCFDAGMNDFLSKPVRKDTLANVIQRWLRDQPSANKPEKTHQPTINAVLLGELPKPIQRLLEDLPPQSTLTVLQTALRQTSPQIEKLLEALKHRNWTTADAIAHRLKGTSKYYAEERFNQLLNRIGARSSDDFEASVDTLIGDLATEYALIQQQLQQAITELQTQLA